MSDEVKIIQNIQDKIAGLPFEFPDINVGPCLDDTLREMGIGDIAQVSTGSNMELYIEIRSVWWFLHRVRNSTLVHFKYSTGGDGKQVDKSMVPKAIKDEMNELNIQFKDWLRTRKSSGSTSDSLWNRSRTTPTTLQGM